MAIPFTENKTKFWSHKDIQKLSRISKMSHQIISNVLGRHKSIGKEKALILEAASRAMGKHVPYMDWLFSASTTHPAFYNEPVESDKLKKAMKIINNM